MLRTRCTPTYPSPQTIAGRSNLPGTFRLICAALVGSAVTLAAVPTCAADGTGSDSATGSADAGPRFEREIAPLLARHCLECHDGASAEGGLDLSQRSEALSGGDGGELFVRGDAAASLIWQYVESDEMPKDRAPLSKKQKAALKSWLDAGAKWTLERIDPDAYLHDGPLGQVWVQRLTVPEYVATVQTALGVDVSEAARRVLPRDERADGFTNTAYNLGVDLEHVQAYSRMASIIVDRLDVEAYVAKHVDCAEFSDECVDRLVRRMGRSLLRGRISDEEVDSYLRLAKAVREQGGDFTEASRYLVLAMLQSPRFIYRIERQVGDGSSKPLEGYELASRLSYILWGASPDEELLDLAEAGRLSEEKVLRKQVRRMLDDPRAIDRSRQFISEWLDLGRLDSLRPNPERFPRWDTELAEDMRRETIAYFHEIAWDQQRPLWKLLNAPFTYATPRLADHYGLFPDQERSDGERGGDGDKRIAGRVEKGLQALYAFSRGRGDTVRDASDSGNDLEIDDPSNVRWREDGLAIHTPTRIAADEPPRRLIEALQKSRELTVEAWVTPADSLQAGPARIVTLSKGTSARNFTLGQDADRYDFRLRTTETDGNGLPSIASPSETAVTGPTHLAVTRSNSGDTTFYLNGREVASGKAEGDFGNWEEGFTLVLANESSGDRGWLGTLHLVAIYDRALSGDQVRQNHAAGVGLVEDRLVSLAVSAAWQNADRSDLVSLYRFGRGDGDTIRDESGSDAGPDLKIRDDSAIRRGESGLSLYGSASVDSGAPAKPLTRAIKKRDSFSVEAWITPADDRQDGPARIVTLSDGSTERNFTLGQDGNRFDARIRGSETSRNGMPSLSGRSGTATPTLTHVVMTKEPSGTARLFVNGEQQATRDVGSSLSDWDDDYRLLIGNEVGGDRPWRGEIRFVAIYKRALSPDEVRTRGSGLARYDLADNPARGGLLTHGSVLTIGGDEASMVARGLFVLHDLLYSRVGNPPACVDTTPIPAEPGMSTRDLAEVRLADASCAGCHQKFEPLAFGLEKFDGVGAYQEVDEHGNELREDGEILFPGAREPVSYETSEKLMELLADSDRVRMAITRKLTQFALGRPLTAEDLPHLKQIHQAAIDDGGTYRALMTAIVTSDLVRTTRTESSE